MQIYQVGGAVRDALLGLPVKDRDWVVVGATAEQMRDLGYRQVGRDFPVFLHPQTGEEYALARTERKSGKGYTGFTVHAAPEVTLEEDLERRDLTINAIAIDEDGNYVDPFNGRADIEARILRHVSPAFREDPLRVLRVARFAARFGSLGFHVASDTMALMREISAADELNHLVPERIWQEMQRALESDSPQVFVAVLKECGALGVILPELQRLFGVPQPEKYHPEIDTGVHMLMVLEQAARLSADTEVRFAALVHDLGKGTTPASEWPSHKGHEERGAALIEALCARLRIPNAYRDLGKLVSLHHTRSHRAGRHDPEELYRTLELLDAFRRPERFARFLLACEADARGRLGLEHESYPQAAILDHALELAQAADLRPVIEAGGHGEELAAAIRRLRIDAIAAGHPPS